MISESQIIAALQKNFPSHIGDDAAIIDKNNDEKYIITKDLLVEDIHFRTTYVNPSNLAHKALQVNLSDLAAMGAKPEFVLLGISIPHHHEQYALKFLENFATCCKSANIILIGGDTTKSPDKIFISITAIGSAKFSHIKQRNSAKAQDWICVIGHLGFAHLGWLACEKALLNMDLYQKAFLQPQAKLAEGRWLASQAAVTSMMDLSDGLFLDLKRLCAASQVQGIIELTQLPPSPHFKLTCAHLQLHPQEIMLAGGEDYGLLFTLEPQSAKQILLNFKKTFGYEIQPIGYLAEGAGIFFHENGQNKKLKLQPFTHFGEKEYD